jgi:hypothetical protein
MSAQGFPGHSLGITRVELQYDEICVIREMVHRAVAEVARI